MHESKRTLISHQAEWVENEGNVFSAKLENAVTLLSDITYIRYTHSPKKREFNAAYLFPRCLSLMKKSMYYTWKSGLFLANSISSEYEHILCIYIFRTSIYKLNANKSIYLIIFVWLALKVFHLIGRKENPKLVLGELIWVNTVL